MFAGCLLFAMFILLMKFLGRWEAASSVSDQFVKRGDQERAPVDDIEVCLYALIYHAFHLLVDDDDLRLWLSNVTVADLDLLKDLLLTLGKQKGKKVTLPTLSLL